jgi:hypothetical protein
VPIPSLTSSEAFDSGVLLEAGVAERLIDHARQVYAGARRVETEQALQDLPTVRSENKTNAIAEPGWKEVPIVNAINHGGEHDVLAAAKQDHESVIELTRDLVTIPSRGGVDS